MWSVCGHTVPECDTQILYVGFLPHVGKKSSHQEVNELSASVSAGMKMLDRVNKP